MSNQNFNNNSNQPNQPQVIVIQNESQALPAVIAFFFGGIGQLIQGRIAAGLLWLFTEVIMGGLLLLMTLGFGIVFTLFTHLLCIIDAAIYKPQSGKKLGILPIIGLLINGGGVILMVLVLLSAGSNM